MLLVSKYIFTKVCSYVFFKYYAIRSVVFFLYIDYQSEV